MQSYYMCLLLYWFFFEECYGTPEIHHYFILNGLGIAYRLKSDIGHLMYASMFSHQTSVCICVSGNYVYYHGKEGRVFAWGKSGLR